MMIDIEDLKRRVDKTEERWELYATGLMDSIKVLQAEVARLRQEMDALHGANIGDPIPDIGRTSSRQGTTPMLSEYLMAYTLHEIFGLVGFAGVGVLFAGLVTRFMFWPPWEDK
jgi:hypothetical protein